MLRNPSGNGGNGVLEEWSVGGMECWRNGGMELSGFFLLFRKLDLLNSRKPRRFFTRLS